MPKEEQPREDKPDFLARSIKSMQDTTTSAGPAAAASYTLVGAVIVLGAAGYGLDRWLGTSPWCLLAGLLLGMLVGFYELIKSVSNRK